MFYILNRNEEIVGLLQNSTDRGNTNIYFDDLHSEDLVTGAETLSFCSCVDKKTSSMLTVGNFIAFKKNNSFRLMQIMETEEEKEEILTKNVYCETVGLELINSIYDGSVMENVDIKQFLNTLLQDTYWNVGYIDSSLTSYLALEIEPKEIYTIIQENLSAFGAEIRFRVEIKDNRVVGRYIDAYSQRGKQDGKRLEIHRDIKKIVRKVDLSNYATKLIGVGKDNLSFKDITISGIDKPLGQNFIVNQDAYEQLNYKGNHITRKFEFDTLDAYELLRQTKKALDEMSKPQITYEIDSNLMDFDDIEVGDTLLVTDMNFEPPLMITARVGNLETSRSDKSKNKAVLTNFKEIKSGLSMFPISGNDILNGAITGDKINSDYTNGVISDSVNASIVQTEILISDYAQITDAEIENLKANNAQIENLVANKADITDLNATNANIENLKADKASINELNALKAEINELDAGKADIGILDSLQADIEFLNTGYAKIEDLEVDKADIKDLNATNATIENLRVDVANIDKLVANKADITDLNATNANIENLVAKDAQIENLVSTKADITDLNASNANIGTLTANLAQLDALVAKKANIGDLNATNANIENLQASHAELGVLVSKKANIDDLKVTNATVGNLQANKADITELNVAKGEITQLKSQVAEIGVLKGDVADIENILAGNITADNIASGAITAGSGIIADGAIGNAQISSVDAGKVTAGTIDTSKVTIQGSDSHLKIKGNRLQVFNGTGSNAVERVSLGDVNGNGSVYGLRVRGADGKTVLLDENGVTSEGITDGSIGNEKISDDANIDGSKLNINSVVSKLNEDGTEVIKGTKIEVNGTSLVTQLSTITNKQTEQDEKITQNSSSIKANENAIKLKVDNQTYQTDKQNTQTSLNKHTSEINLLKDEVSLKVDRTGVEEIIDEVNGELIDSKIDTAKAEIKVTTDKISQNVTNLTNTVSNKADGSTVTTLSNKVGTLETSVNGISGKVTNLEKTTTTLGTNVSNAQNTANTANSTANSNKTNITNLQGEVSTVKSDIASLEVTTSGISQKVSNIETTNATLTTQVNTANTNATSALNKANSVDSKVGTLQTDYNSTKSKVATLETNLDSITSRVSATETNLSTTTNKIDNLQIGARNYLLNGNFSKTITSGNTDKHENLYPQNWGGYNGGIPNPTTSYHAHIDTETFGYNVCEFNETDGSRNWKGISQTVNDRFAKDKKYRLSLDVYATNNGGRLFGGFHYTKTGETTMNFHSGQYSFNLKDITLNSWNRVSCEVPYPVDVDTSKTIQFYIYGYGFSNNMVLYIKNVSLNQSTQTTDWTPAPEDVQSQIDTTNTNVSNLTSRVSTAESKLTKDSLTTTIGSHYTTSSDVNGIVTSKGYATTSQVTQTVDGLSAKFSSSGGYNLLRNSTGANGTTTGWTHSGTSIGTSPNENISAGSRYYMYLDNGTTTGERYAFSPRFKLLPNKVYRFTGYFHNYTACTNFDVFVLGSTTLAETDTSTTYDTVTQLISSQNTNGSWKKYTLTFTTPANVKSGYIRIDNNGYNSSGTGSNRIHWHCLTLTEGELEVPWSPHPSEIYDGVTTIDKNGVKVSQSNYNGYTQMKADGFYVNNGSENVISVTKDGATFKGKVTIQSGSTVPTSTLSGTISSGQLASTITSDISTAKTNASTALSTANTAKSTADTAKSTATTANTNATTALNTANSVNTTVNNGKTNWNNAYNRVNEWAYGAVTGSTTIDGGYIQANTIVAEKIALGDFTNYAELNANTLSKWGWTSVADSSATSNPWFQRSSISRDNQISKYYTCNGGESLRIKADIFTSVYGQASSGGTATATARSVGIMIFTINADGSRGYFCNSRVTATSTSGNTGTVNNVVTLPTTARQFAVYVQIDGYPTFSGTLRVRNVQVTKMSSGELIVDGSITAGKIASSAVTTDKLNAQAVTADKIKTGSITATQIASNTITANQLATGSVTADEIASGAVTATKIASRTITADRIASGAITANEIASGTITADRIKSGAITASMITTGTLDASKVTVTNLNASNITSGTISGDRIKGGTLSATNEINFVGGARIFGNAGAYGAGLKTSASEYYFGSGSASFESDVYVKGNLVYHAGNKPTPSAIGALSTSGGTVSGATTFSSTLRTNNVFYGMNKLAIARGSIYIPNFGSNYTWDYIKGGASSIAFADTGVIHFMYNGTRSSHLAQGTVYLPHNGNTTCDHFRMGFGIMASPSSGSFHFLNANGGTSPLYSGTVYTKSILTANETKTITEKSVFDEINNINVISTKDGLRLFNPVETTDELDSSPCVVKTQYNKEKEHIETDMDYTSAIATLWKAVQELKEENQELKNKIKELMPSA